MLKDEAKKLRRQIELVETDIYFEQEEIKNQKEKKAKAKSRVPANALITAGVVVVGLVTNPLICVAGAAYFAGTSIASAVTTAKCNKNIAESKAKIAKHEDKIETICTEIKNVVAKNKENEKTVEKTSQVVAEKSKVVNVAKKR